MTSQAVTRDERTVATENASYRWAYLVMSFGLLLAIALRSFVWQESSWDLLALVVVGGVVATVYQGARHVLNRRWAMLSGIAVVVATAFAVATAVMR